MEAATPTDGLAAKHGEDNMLVKIKRNLRLLWKP